MAQQSIEDRLARLESKIAEYEAERAQMRDLAGLRVDVQELRTSQHELRDDLRLRIQAMGAEIRDEIDSQVDVLRTEYQAGYTYLGEKIGNVEEQLTGVEEHLNERIDELQTGQQELQADVQTLQTGQRNYKQVLPDSRARCKGWRLASSRSLNCCKAGGRRRTIKVYSSPNVGSDMLYSKQNRAPGRQWPGALLAFHAMLIQVGF